jgi:hypothetical protein
MDSDQLLLLLQALLGCLMTKGASSPGPSWLLDDKGGEESRLKPQACAVWVAVCVAPV